MPCLAPLHRRALVPLAVLVALAPAALACDSIGADADAIVTDLQGNELGRVAGAAFVDYCSGPSGGPLDGHLVWRGHAGNWTATDWRDGTGVALPPGQTPAWHGMRYTVVEGNVTRTGPGGEVTTWRVEGIPERVSDGWAIGVGGDRLLAYDLEARAWRLDATLSSLGLPEDSDPVGHDGRWLVTWSAGKVRAVDAQSGTVGAAIGTGMRPVVGFAAGRMWVRDVPPESQMWLSGLDNGTLAISFLDGQWTRLAAAHLLDVDGGRLLFAASPYPIAPWSLPEAPAPAATQAPGQAPAQASSSGTASGGSAPGPSLTLALAGLAAAALALRRRLA